MKNFQNLAYSTTPNIDDNLYWAGFLAKWLSGLVLSDSSMTVRLETFLMVVKMARGKKYSLNVLHLAWAYYYLRKFKETNGVRREPMGLPLIMG